MEKNSQVKKKCVTIGGRKYDFGNYSVNVNNSVKSSGAPSSSSEHHKAAQIHQNKDVYLLRGQVCEYSGERIVNVLFRFTVDLFSEAAQKAMKKSSIVSSLIFQDQYDYLKHKVERVIDIISEGPNSSGRKCKAAHMTSIQFMDIVHCTPTAFVQRMENGLCNSSGSVQLVDGRKTEFQKSTLASSQLSVLFLSSQVINNCFSDTGAEETLALSAEALRRGVVDDKGVKFEKCLSEALNANPILPEERVFTVLRVLVFQQRNNPKEKKPIDDVQLKAFYQLLDNFEFWLRYHTHPEALKVQDLCELYKKLAAEMKGFSCEGSFSTKIVNVLDALKEVISVFEGRAESELFVPVIKAFVVKILNDPLKQYLKCSLPAEDTRQIATKNLVLRSSLLLSQFEIGLEGQFPETVEGMRKVAEAFRKDNWVKANSLLCDVVNGEFFQQVIDDVPGDFQDPKTLTPYKLVGSVINLIDFFNDVVSSSSRYQWVNFVAVKETHQYLTKPEGSLGEGQLSSLRGWVEQLKEAGYQEFSIAFKDLFTTLKKFKEVKTRFEDRNKQALICWLERVCKEDVDAETYRGLCSTIDESYSEIEQVNAEISLHVNMIQALIVLFAGKKGVPPIDPDLLGNQLDVLNRKITEICYPFVYFIHNFRILMLKEQVAPRIKSITTFETHKDKLFASEVPVHDLGEDLEIHIEDENGSTAADASEETSMSPALDPVKPSSPASKEVDALESCLKDVFSNKNRRKILANLNKFFKLQNRQVKIDSGKGSHIKLFIGNTHISIPASKQLKIGTAGSIRDDILKELRKLAT